MVLRLLATGNSKLFNTCFQQIRARHPVAFLF